MEPGSDDRDLIHPEASSPPKTDADVAPLIQKVGAAEGQRIQRETARYIKFAQLASASVETISNILSGWRQAGHPLQKFVTRSPADDSAGHI